MTLKVVRGFFVLACMIMGVLWTNYLWGDPPIGEEIADWRVLRFYLLGGFGGVAVAGGILFGLAFVTQELFERLFPVFIAITLSMVLGYFLSRYIIMVTKVEDLTMHVYLTSTLVLVCAMVGIALGLKHASNWESLRREVKKKHIEFGNPKIVDTSVLIDGRIRDIVQTGFIDGTLIIPRFVLRELQHIADSEETLRRAKGRRGLEILKGLQDPSLPTQVEVVEDDPATVRDVDGKLVALAKEYKAMIITNDFNLNKVAQIEGVAVLNINDLANALKPMALPDEELTVKIVKEGKEAYQGVGYLDDGTMIVVDGGRSHVGKNVTAIVTSVLQTAAGRMIFAKMERSA